jgi:hypothetical protein
LIKAFDHDDSTLPVTALDFGLLIQQTGEYTSGFQEDEIKVKHAISAARSSSKK